MSAGAADSPVAAVDVGSTAIKAALVGGDGRRRHELAAPVATRRDGERVELDAAAIAAAVEELLAALAARVRPAAVALACQRSTCLLWERASARPLGPARSWMDLSAAGRVAALAPAADRVAARTGLRLSAHYAAPKLAALLDATPDGRRRAAAGELVAGTLDAFLVHRLTGAPATEPGQAGRTLLYALAEDAWDAGLAALFGVPLAALPALRPSAGAWGETPIGAPLAAVAGDQQAALVGHGGWRPGVAAAHFGTGAFVLAATGETPRRHPGLLTAVLAALGDGRRRFQLEGSVNSAGSAFDEALARAGLDAAAWSERELDPERLPSVLPALAGVAAPWWRERPRGLLGAPPDATPEALVGGTLAGIAMRVLDCVEALGAAGVALDTLRVSGRLTRLRGLVALLADAGQVAVEVAADEETGLAGVAALARAGLTGSAAPLAVVPATAWRREPAWPAARAAAVRERWRSFVGGVLAAAER